MLHAPTARPRARMPLALLVAFCLAFAAPACRPSPVPDDGPVSTPSAWTDTARTVLSTLRWAVPAAKVVVGALVADPGRAVVVRALDAVTDAAGRLDAAVAAYDARGGDRCAAKAAVAGVRAALVSAAQVLADHGIALGVVLERVVDAAAALVDELVPGCDPDAGWQSAGRATDAELRAIELRATSRGAVLRRDLDNLRPPEGAR